MANGIARRRRNRPALPLSIGAAAALAVTTAAHASCGSAFCTLMTDRYAQGTGIPHDGWSLDSHYESIVQDRLRRGTQNLEPSDVTDEEDIERKTDNQNLVTSLGYGINSAWSVSLRIPVANRDHVHDVVDEESGAPAGEERWSFTRLGDVQATVRRQSIAANGKASFAVFGGLKLPTGVHDLVNDQGVAAERALQPGSGTTDVVGGVAARRAIGSSDALIGQASVSEALGASDGFEPGRRLELSAGWSHAFSPKLGSVVQLNYQRRQSDRGPEAEPENSGSTIVNLSPGATLGVGHSSTVYTFVQVPIYERVTGTQLVPHYALSVGWTRDLGS